MTSIGDTTMILTDAYLQSCKPPTEKDGTKFPTRAVWALPSGSRRVACDPGPFGFEIRDREKSSRIGLGPYPAVSLAKAREQARAMQGLVAAGQNPITAKRRARVEAPQRTFGALAERYMSEHAERHKRTCIG
jgi:hypothetical protein